MAKQPAQDNGKPLGRNTFTTSADQYPFSARCIENQSQAMIVFWKAGFGVNLLNYLQADILITRKDVPHSFQEFPITLVSMKC
ncbi:MAG: hypothetical protein EA399_13860 [Desulfovibrionales bacterium]|nr:MAG: hypothetical protein EA399_13860 [Desulfovibrionales bacterium]